MPKFADAPSASGILGGLVPSPALFNQPGALYIAIGIIGATVMPHNLYLHSSIVQTRKYLDDHSSKAEAIRFATIDSTVALMSALFINGAILVMAAAAFHGTGHEDVADISDAYRLLEPLMGTKMASILFAVALLGLSVNVGITLLAIYRFGAMPILGKILGIGIAFLVNFALNLGIVFRGRS